MTHDPTGPHPADDPSAWQEHAATVHPLRRPLAPGHDPDDGLTLSGDRLLPGGAFILDTPDEVPAVWGAGDEVLWAQGESLLVCGPSGVGKTTLVGQLLAARLGLRDEVLGWPVEPGTRRVLYLASDRPRQIARAFGRLFTEKDREHLDDRLRIWDGPPPVDFGQHPQLLTTLAAEAGADTVFLDSLKDMAVGLSDDTVGAGVNLAVQYALHSGVEVVALHHQRKGSEASSKPNKLADVYGSTWITAGAGSVVLLWGAAGDALVELTHLKQPAGIVGPLKIEHDHLAGTSSIHRGFDPLRYLRLHPKGVTALEAAQAMHDTQVPGDNARRQALRSLDSLVKRGLAHRQDGQRGGAGGATAARYFPVDTRHGDPG